jgi:hypothetical protein
MKTLLVGLVSVALTLSTQGAEKVPPKKPVEVTARVGAVLGTEKRVDVTLSAVAATDPGYRVRITDGTRPIEFPLSDAAPISAALAKLAGALKVGDKAVVGSVAIDVLKLDRGACVVMHQKESVIPVAMLDGDGAAELAKTLATADGVAAWLGPRLAGLIPD